MATSYSDALVAYGHGAVQLNLLSRTVKQVKVPPGMCVVTVVDVGDAARFGVQSAFHELCKLANQTTGRVYRTWILNPLKFQGEIEQFINERTSDAIFTNPVTGAREPIVTKMHIATAGTLTPDFIGYPWAGSGKKSGLHWLSTAGEGLWFKSFKNNSDVQLKEILQCVKGAVRPAAAAVEDIQQTNAELMSPPVSSETWDAVLQTEIKYNMSTIQKVSAGKTVVFYNIPCRVSEYDVGVVTRSVFAPARAASSQHAQYAETFRRPVNPSASRLIRRKPALNEEQELPEDVSAGVGVRGAHITGFGKDENGNFFANVCNNLGCAALALSAAAIASLGVLYGRGGTRRNRKIRSKTRKHSRRNF
jgi:hypothetical protein